MERGVKERKARDDGQLAFLSKIPSLVDKIDELFEQKHSLDTKTADMFFY